MTRLLDAEASAPLTVGGSTLPLRTCGHKSVLDVPSSPREVVSRVRHALVMLRDPESTEQLVRRIPAAAAALGFDLVVYAHLAGSRWQPAAFFGRSYARDAGSGVLLEEPLVDHIVLENPMPVAVDETRAHRLLPVSWCRSYLVAPIVERGVVIGLIHVGRRGALRSLGVLDREVLWTFVEALTSYFTSARAVDGLRELMSRTTALAGAFGGAEAAHDVRASVPPTLSVRELDVLELMAAGHTNGQIARRLVITEGTAKSHVKRIMRKLQAANRAEAVAAWIRLTERAPALEGS